MGLGINREFLHPPYHLAINANMFTRSGRDKAFNLSLIGPLKGAYIQQTDAPVEGMRRLRVRKLITGKQLVWTFLILPHIPRHNLQSHTRRYYLRV